ncbi:MAG: hypothetical protein A2X11_08730 [Bacteroidetes bacterium GWE2_42_24]|nr:MAG: hypothetical protein A2X11_08730 [Bacteroidetes bacterium GWE2_42_24]PKP23331.1 MAG: hypothetical protein CVU06_08800 [Bacteroidetes bacterium HGW-Bacteroidetes-22]
MAVVTFEYLIYEGRVSIYFFGTILVVAIFQRFFTYEYRERTPVIQQELLRCFNIGHRIHVCTALEAAPYKHWGGRTDTAKTIMI